LDRPKDGTAKDPLSLPPPYPVDAVRSQLAQNHQLLAGTPMPAADTGILPGVALADALRFDVTPAWVNSTWSQVTPQRLETGWYGLRVPLVTGTDPTDLAGSLTYYFNAQDYVERITLCGVTDDAEPLTSLMQQHYGLRPLTTLGRGVFLSFYQDVPIGMLRIEDAVVARPGEPRSRFRVLLELNLPRPGASLSADLLPSLRRLQGGQRL
jgi:hypothetical protein